MQMVCKNGFPEYTRTKMAELLLSHEKVTEEYWQLVGLIDELIKSILLETDYTSTEGESWNSSEDMTGGKGSNFCFLFKLFLSDSLPCFNF
jgi:hypothetical protein